VTSDAPRSDAFSSLPAREGRRPRTTAPAIPHQQIDQQPTDPVVHDGLARRLFALPGVGERLSGISVPGARALWLTGDEAPATRAAFLVDREFAHLHPAPDFSMHLTLPTLQARQAISLGWAEWHPFVAEGRLPPTLVLVFAPRTHDEARIVERLVRSSLRFASDADDAAPRSDHP
jgi:hypothetical protein